AVGFLDTFLATSAALSAAGLSADQWLALGFLLRYARRLRPRDARLLLAYAWGHAAVLCLTSLKVLRLARGHCRRSDVVTMQALALLAEARGHRHRQPAPGARPRVGLPRALLVGVHVASWCAPLRLCRVCLRVCICPHVPTARRELLRGAVTCAPPGEVRIRLLVWLRCLSKQKRHHQWATRKIGVFIGPCVVCFVRYVMTGWVLVVGALLWELPDTEGHPDRSGFLEELMALSLKGLGQLWPKERDREVDTVIHFVEEEPEAQRACTEPPAGWWSSGLCLMSTRWGVLDKCLAYSKVVADLSMCSLLRWWLCQVLAGVACQLLRRHLCPVTACNSSLDVENDICLQWTH
ncbi:PREDICTED: G-protein coupled receptor 78, partial [Galeopterus variegatus]|uniref:G-protein coupled receptor 78 n=1 Tax=Galeopterus variegatus TaxID=482537 RepID=A0ABM0R8M0_GALVR